MCLQNKTNVKYFREYQTRRGSTHSELLDEAGCLPRVTNHFDLHSCHAAQSIIITFVPKVMCI